MSNVEKTDVNESFFDTYASRMGISEDYQAFDREKELQALDANLEKELMNNILLIAPPGSGKSKTVEYWAWLHNKDVETYSIDLTAMGESGENLFARRLKGLMNEVMDMLASGKNICIFIDEVHIIGMPGYQSGLEALKPAMARGEIKFIGATTDEEYVKYILPNEALTQRFTRLDLPIPTDETTYQILVELWNKTLPHLEVNERLIRTIIDYANRFIPADAQPRKSLKLFDEMLGWHRSQGFDMNEELLDARLFATTGANPKWQVDIEDVSENMHERVKGQDFALDTLEDSLEVAVAGLNEKGRPVGNYIFVGSTGVGKALHNIIPVATYNYYNKSIEWKQHGDLEIGDYVFNRYGKPVKITGVYPQGLQEAYKITFGDGSTVICNDQHLWTYTTMNDRHVKEYTNTLRYLLDNGLTKAYGDGRLCNKYKIPTNKEIALDEKKFEVDPYLVGAFIGNGCMTLQALTFSSNDKFIDEKIKNLLASPEIYYQPNSYSLCFRQFNKRNIQRNDVFGHLPEINGKYSHEKRIPDMYKHGSIEQRWDLIQGLFDTDGSITYSGGRYNIRYDSTSEGLIDDIQYVLKTLGFMSTKGSYQRNTREGIQRREFCLRVKSSNELKYKFFSTPRKRDLAIEAKKTKRNNVKTFDHISIVNVEKLDEKLPMTCIMVDDPEHLYCVTKDFIVTHNTETVKAMAEGLFGSEENMIRFDMSEYQTVEDVSKFREENADAITKKPYTVVLYDEVEKSHKGVMDLLLQILGDGRLTNRYGRQVSFRNAYVVLTTNVGNNIFQEAQEQDRDITEKLSLVRSALFQNFRPELLGRLDKVIPFVPLSPEVRKEISIRELTKFTEMVNNKGVYLNLQANVNKFITEDNVNVDTRQGGARDLKGRIKDSLYVPVAKLLNRHPNVISITMGVFGDMSADNKTILRSRANIDILTFVEKIDKDLYYVYQGNNYIGERGENREIFTARSDRAFFNREMITSYAAVKKYL